jgi:hypothetical protein
MDIIINKKLLTNNPILTQYNNKLINLGYYRDHKSLRDRTINQLNNYFINVDNNEFSYNELLMLYNMGAIIEKYVFYIYADSEILEQEVNENLPNRLNEDNTIKKYSEWIYSPQYSFDESKVIFPAGVGQYIIDLPLIKYIGGTIIRTAEVIDIVSSYTWNPDFNLEDENPIKTIKDLQFLYEDYKKYRSEIRTIANNIGWDNLSDIDKDIVAENFINIGWTIQRLGFGTEIYNIKSRLFDLNSQKARELRFNKLRQAVANLMPRNNAHEVAEVLINKNLYTSYVLSGIEGSMKIDITGLADPIGIYDYILGSDGTEYENIGIAKMSFNSNNGLNASQFADYLINILDNG